jgi:integral membrane protein
VTEAPAQSPTESQVRGALKRYKVMAFVTGTFLLILCVDMILKYIVGVDNPTFLSVADSIAIIHGWIFIIYLFTVVQLWLQQRWGFGRLVTMGLGGIIPFLSFIIEGRIEREVLGNLAAREAA